jgi:two-component system, NarL family, nitrate/nitrite response regulator NarL
MNSTATALGSRTVRLDSSEESDPTPGETVRILIADDHPLVRQAIAVAIRRQPDLEIVGEASNGTEALESIRNLRPDVALIDLRMSPLGGLQVLAALAKENLPTRVLVLSAFSDGADVHEALLAGAAGYLTKDQPLGEIREGIRRVARGERYLSPEAQAALLEQLQLSARITRPPLSPRELDILRLTAEGKSSAAIGKELHISQSTVKNHQQHIYDKLGVSNAPAAIHEAMSRGLLQ